MEGTENVKEAEENIAGYVSVNGLISSAVAVTVRKYHELKTFPFNLLHVLEVGPLQVLLTHEHTIIWYPLFSNVLNFPLGALTHLQKSSEKSMPENNAISVSC